MRARLRRRRRLRHFTARVAGWPQPTRYVPSGTDLRTLDILDGRARRGDA